MRTPEKLKLVMVGAGSVSFCPATLSDILLNDRICSIPLTISLMDIDEKALKISERFAREALAILRKVGMRVPHSAVLEKCRKAGFAVEAARLSRWRMAINLR